MSLSKVSRKRAISKSSVDVHFAGAVKAKTGSENTYNVAANIPYNTKVRNPAAKAKVFTESNLIVLTVNPELDKAASEEKLNAKAESAKQMFSDYRNKK